MLAWLSVWRLVLHFWYRLTRVVPEKGPLNGCVCVTVRVNKMHTQRTNFLPKLLSLCFVILSTSAHYRPFSAMKSQTTIKRINDIKHTHMRPFNGPLSGTTQLSWYQMKKKKDLHSQQGPLCGSSSSLLCFKPARVVRSNQASMQPVSQMEGSNEQPVL